MEHDSLEELREIKERLNDLGDKVWNKGKYAPRKCIGVVRKKSVSPYGVPTLNFHRIYAEDEPRTSDDSG